MENIQKIINEINHEFEHVKDNLTRIEGNGVVSRLLKMDELLKELNTLVEEKS